MWKRYLWQILHQDFVVSLQLRLHKEYRFAGSEGSEGFIIIVEVRQGSSSIQTTQRCYVFRTTKYCWIHWKDEIFRTYDWSNREIRGKTEQPRIMFIKREFLQQTMLVVYTYNFLPMPLCTSGSCVLMSRMKSR